MFSKKRKISEVSEKAVKYYAVRAGHSPGVYLTWADCQEQITGFRGANFKSFPNRSDAEKYAAGQQVQEPPSAARNKPEKFYGVAVGAVPGVYLTWDEAEKQIKNVKGPKYKKFGSREEAEEFVKNGGPAKPTPRKKSVVTQEEPDDSDEDAPSSKRAKTSSEPSTPSVSAPKSSGTVARDKKKGESKLVVYTDGSSLGNGKKGAQAGVGVYFGDNDPRNVSEPLQGDPQTNQRAELTAVLRALEICPRNRDMVIITDSNYSINCCSLWYKSWQSNNWRTSTGGAVMNQDLVAPIRALIDERDARGTKTEFKWIKGHSNDAGNEAADRLAVNGARAIIR